MLSRISLILLLALPATTALSGGHLTMNCTGLDPAKDGDADTAFLCLADYQERLDALETKMAKLIDANSGAPKIGEDSFAATSHGAEAHSETYLTALPPELLNVVPAGAVVAFDLSDGCPDGWSPFAAGQSRTIIGASFGIPPGLFRDEELRQRKYRDHGGEERVVLSIAQMPTHRHVSQDFDSLMTGVGAGQAPNGLMEDNPDSGRANLYRRSEMPETGGSQPHENMPPFIALYYCKKD